MKFYANRKRTEKSIFLKLRSYRQLSAKLIKDHKLSKKKKKSWTFLYSGKNWNRRLQVKLTPFLPNPSGVSYYFIKPHKADILNTIVSSLPSSFKDNNPILAPTVILNRRTIQSSHNTTEQVLIQW